MLRPAWSPAVPRALVFPDSPPRPRPSPWYTPQDAYNVREQAAPALSLAVPRTVSVIRRKLSPDQFGESHPRDAPRSEEAPADRTRVYPGPTLANRRESDRTGRIHTPLPRKGTPRHQRNHHQERHRNQSGTDVGTIATAVPALAPHHRKERNVPCPIISTRRWRLRPASCTSTTCTCSPARAARCSSWTSIPMSTACIPSRASTPRRAMSSRCTSTGPTSKP